MFNINKIYKKSPSYITIKNIILNIRKVIAENYKEKYKNNLIGNEYINVALDESLFIHENHGSPIWVVGAIQTDTKAIRLDIIPQRNSQNLKIFVIII